MPHRTCSIDGCPQPHSYNGLCLKHVARLNKTGTTDEDIRTAICLGCFNVFTFKMRGGLARKYCTKKCGTRSARKIRTPPFDLTVICRVCGVSFQQMRAIGAHAYYCSVRCRALGSRDSQKQATHRRRARLHHAGCEFIRCSDIFERDCWVCQLCGRPVDKKLVWPNDAAATLDHIRPLSRGGGHTRANVQLAHWGCNRNKRDTWVNDRVYAVLERK